MRLRFFAPLSPLQATFQIAERCERFGFGAPGARSNLWLSRLCWLIAFSPVGAGIAPGRSPDGIRTRTLIGTGEEGT